LVAGLALACYVQTSGYALVWDDNLQIENNDRIRTFSNLGLAFKEQFWAFMGHWHYYRPLQTVSYMVGYAIGGLSPAPYHWLNIILHIFTTLAGLWLGWELFHNARIAVWGAALFAAHPMHTESVAWSGAITDIGCGLLYFIAVASWLRSQEGRRRWLWLACSAVTFLAALLFKEMAATFPVLAIGLDLMHDRGAGIVKWQNRLVRWLSLVLVSVVYLAMRIGALGSFAPTAKLMPVGPADYVLTDVYFAGLYLAKLLFPLGHNAYRVFVPFSQLSVADWGLPVFLLAAWMWLTWKVLNRDLRLSFLAGWTVFTLIPVLNIGSVGKNVFCERYLYIPSLGFCILLIALVVSLWDERFRMEISAAGMVVVAVFAALTIQRNPVWRDNRTLLTMTLGVPPDVTKRHQDLGISYLRSGALESALSEFEEALRTEEQIFIRSPENQYAALIGISTVHMQAGRFDQAWDYAAKARALYPERGDAFRILGTIRSAERKDGEAEELLSRCVALNPSDIAAQVNLGSVLLLRRNPSAAEDHFRRALELDPLSVPARLGLAFSLEQLGHRSDALASIREILARDPGNAEALKALKELGPESSSTH
jgi:Tfp pilus assembly protein PilF